MSFYRESTITWGGVDYDYVATLGLICKIEKGRPETGPVSLAMISNKAASGEALFSLMSYVISDVMKHAGVPNVTPEMIHAEFLGSGSESDVIALWAAVESSLTPMVKDQKKADAPGEK